MKTCPVCNTLNEDSATECVDCKTGFSGRPSSSPDNLVLVGVALAIIGFGLLLYGNSQNNSIVSQLSSMFGSGRTNPGTPWIIIGCVVIGIGAILIVKKLLGKK